MPPSARGSLVIAIAGALLLAGCPKQPAGQVEAAEARPSAPRSDGPERQLLAQAPAPASPAPRLDSFVATPALRDLRFEFDRDEVRPEDLPVLARNAEWLRVRPETMLLIEGHSDQSGSHEYNLLLAERRARITHDHLVRMGIAAARITIASYGQERPVCAEPTPECRARNRRVHFRVHPAPLP